MYALVSRLKSQPVISLQTGQMVAEVGQPILDIAKLEVQGYTCTAVSGRRKVILLTHDIRQFATDCLIIDDEDQLTEPGDVVRLESSLKHPYTPLGKKVAADTGRRLGTVNDYSINLDSARVQRLYVKPPVWRAWYTPSLIIDRTQIIDITPELITVRDATITEPVIAPDSLPEIHP